MLAHFDLYGCHGDSLLEHTVKMSAQAESVIRNIIREITLECSSHGQAVSETLAAFMVSVYFARYITYTPCYVKKQKSV